MRTVSAKQRSSVSLRNGTGDQEHGSFLQNLATVAGDVYFNSRSTVGSILKGLVTVEGNVTLENLCSGSTRSMGPLWFDSLVTIGGDLTFSHSTMTQYYGLMHQLESVQGTLSMNGSALQDFPLPNQGHELLLGGLSVVGNPLLSSLNASHVRLSSAGPITFEGNCVLSTATAQGFIDAQITLGWSGAAQVSTNETGPATCTACFTLP
jgi:hypothetical protein